MENRLRLYNMINLGSNMPTIHIPVDTVEEALVIGMRMAKDQLEREDEIETNVFGLQIFRDGDWEEWEDSDGSTFDDKWEEAEALAEEIFGT